MTCTFWCSGSSFSRVYTSTEVPSLVPRLSLFFGWAEEKESLVSMVCALSVVPHIGVLLGGPSHVPNPLSNVHLGRKNEVPSCHSCSNHSGTTHHFSYYHRAKWWLWYHSFWLLLLCWPECKRYALWCCCSYVHHLHISLDNHNMHSMQQS